MKAVIAAAQTGGHINPGLAIANKIKKEEPAVQDKTQETIKSEDSEKPKKAKKTDTAKKEEKQLIADKNDDVVISKERLEKIEKEIKRQTTIPEEKKKKINKRIFKNILIASAIVLYFISINLGFYNLDPVVYLKDLQVFSIIVIGITIFVIERAYKKDSTELTIHGIELLVLSICTLMTIFTGIKYSDKYPYIINLISILFAIYYVAKSIVIYIKMKNKALKRTRDINKITGNVE